MWCHQNKKSRDNCTSGSKEKRSSNIHANTQTPTQKIMFVLFPCPEQHLQHKQRNKPALHQKVLSHIVVLYAMMSCRHLFVCFLTYYTFLYMNQGQADRGTDIQQRVKFCRLLVQLYTHTYKRIFVPMNVCCKILLYL